MRLSTWLAISGLALPLGCKDKGSTATDSASGTTDSGSSGTDTSTGGDDTGTAVEWVTLAATCEAPTVGTPPVAQLGEIQDSQTSGDWFMEIVDLEVAVPGELIFGAGQGGVMAFDVTDPANPEKISHYPTGGGIGRYYHVEPGEEGVLYVTHRDKSLEVLDASDPADIQFIDDKPGDKLEGLTRVDDRLYIVALDGTLRVYDLSVPADPDVIGYLESGLGSAWDIAVDGNVAWVASNTMGVVTVDLSDETEPAPVGSLDVDGGAQDLAVGDGVLYVAVGGAGVAVVDLTDPLAPELLSHVDVAGSVQSVAVDLGSQVLWAVDQKDVLAFDISTPASPLPLGSVTTAEFAMHVAADDGVAYVGDWTRMGVWAADRAIAEPDLDLTVSEVLVSEDASTVEIGMQNRGQGTLSLAGALVEDDRFTVQVSAETLAPGEEGTIRLEFSGGEDVETTLCIASNDPVDPQVYVGLAGGGSGAHALFGTEAPDFALEDLDGVTHVLSEQRGHPVLIAFFGTW